MKKILLFGMTSAVMLFFGEVGNSPAADGWPLESILKILEAREQSIHSLEAFVNQEYVEGIDWESYCLAMKAKEDAEARFFGIPGGGKPPLNETKGHWPAPQYFHFKRNDFGEIRIDEMAGPKNEPDPLLMHRVCFDGKVWEIQHIGSRPPRVIIDKAASIAPVLQTLALGSPFCASNGSFFPFVQGKPETFWHFLEHARASNEIDVPKKIANPRFPGSVELVARRKYDNYFGDHGIHLQVTMVLDPSIGLAPRSLHSTQIIQVNGKFQEIGSPRGYTVEWGEYVEVVPGAWLAKTMIVKEWAGIILPKYGKDFQPVLVNGKPTFASNGMKIWDVSKTQMHRFIASEHRFKVTDLQANHLSKDPLCAPKHPAGTVVQDNTKQEVYELEGATPASDARLRKNLLRRNLAFQPPTQALAFNWALFLGGYAGVLFLVAGIVYWLKKRKGGGRSGAEAIVACISLILLSSCGSRRSASSIQFDYALDESKQVTVETPGSCPYAVHSFPFRNSGSRSVTITGIEPSCACRASKLSPQVVEAGEEGIIHLTVDLSQRYGQFETYALVQVSDAPETQIKLTTLDYLIRSPFVMPDSVDFGSVVAGQSRQRNVELVVDLVPQAKMPVVELAHATNGFQFRASQMQLDSEATARTAKMEIACTCLAADAGREIKDVLKISWDGLGRVLEVPVKARGSHPRFSVQPPTVFFGPVGPAGAKQRVAIRANDPSLPTLCLTAEPDDPAAVRARLETGPGETILWLEPKLGDRSFLEGEITIRETDGKRPPYFLRYLACEK
jgi:hypothetical protein